MPRELSGFTLEHAEAGEKPALFPSNSAETINSLVHYYRGELGRMTSWRDRIDRTSNWAITMVAALLSVSLSTPTSHHGVVLFGMLLVSLLLLIEARRYRFFDVYRARVRLLERGYFAELLGGRSDIGTQWQAAISRSLRSPLFLMDYREALFRRLRRNYCWMYLILLLAWLLKITSPKLQPDGLPVERAWTDVIANAALGPLSGWWVIAAVAIFYVLVLLGSLHVEPDDGELAHGEVHV